MSRRREYNSISIDLQNANPLERLKEFCRVTGYCYKFRYDEFKNGTLCFCGIWNADLPPLLLTSKTHWVLRDNHHPGDRIVENTLAALVLRDMGLEPPASAKDLLSEFISQAGEVASALTVPDGI